MTRHLAGLLGLISLLVANAPACAGTSLKPGAAADRSTPRRADTAPEPDSGGIAETPPPADAGDESAQTTAATTTRGSSKPATNGNGFSVTYFDVGQGDGALVRTPSGKTILIDAGPPDAGRDVARRLAAMGIETIDLVIASHAHADHIGGLVDVLRRFKVRAFLDSGVPHPTPTYRDYLAEVERQKDRGAQFWVARKGRTIKVGEVTVEVLAPEEPLHSGTRSDVNSNSVAVRVVYGGVRFLFIGDAEAPTEERLAAQGEATQAQVLKVAHHGGRHSSTARFLATVKPEIAVISCGRNNQYGHPKAAALERIKARARIMRTDLDGTITITSDGRTFMASKEGAPATPEQTIGPVGAYVASRRGKTFHRSDCPSAERIRKENRVEFGTWGEAAASGRKPHRRCMP